MLVSDPSHSGLQISLEVIDLNQQCVFRFLCSEICLCLDCWMLMGCCYRVSINIPEPPGSHVMFLYFKTHPQQEPAMLECFLKQKQATGRAVDWITTIWDPSADFCQGNYKYIQIKENMVITEPCCCSFRPGSSH